MTRRRRSAAMYAESAEEFLNSLPKVVATEASDFEELVYADIARTIESLQLKLSCWDYIANYYDHYVKILVLCQDKLSLSSFVRAYFES